MITATSLLVCTAIQGYQPFLPRMEAELKRQGYLLNWARVDINPNGGMLRYQYYTKGATRPVLSISAEILPTELVPDSMLSQSAAHWAPASKIPFGGKKAEVSNVSESRGAIRIVVPYAITYISSHSTRKNRAQQQEHLDKIAKLVSYELGTNIKAVMQSKKRFTMQFLPTK